MRRVVYDLELSYQSSSWSFVFMVPGHLHVAFYMLNPYAA